MVTPESKPPEEAGQTQRGAGGKAAQRPLTTLRAGGVDVDPRLVGRIAVGLILAVLTVLVVVLFVVGFQKNARITQLRQHGVPATITVSGCSGLLGGSGSNGAGYTCRGTFSVDSHRYNEVIPGNVFRRPGSSVRGVVVPSSPGLMSTASVLATERSSGRVFILPTILLIALVLLVGVVLLRRRSRVSVPPAAGTPPS